LTLENGKVERLTHSFWRKLGPAYAPDGRSIAFMEKGVVRWHLSLLDLASGDVRELSVSGGGGGGLCRPAFSPDGRLLAYVATRETPKADIWIREMRGPREGSSWRIPTVADAYNYDPAFSPDGTALALASTPVRGDSERWSLFVVDVNGRNLVQVTRGEGSDRFPEWRPVVSSTRETS
jgi:TolB protein